MEISVRKAVLSDDKKILDMLIQIGKIHEDGRPDLFKPSLCKYDLKSVDEMITSADKIIFVADCGGAAVGYAICMIKELDNQPTLRDARLLYIDDFCVDETLRGNNIGRRIMQTVKEYAHEINTERIELNVWDFNQSAKLFYEKCGFKSQRTEMEFLF